MDDLSYEVWLLYEGSSLTLFRIKRRIPLETKDYRRAIELAWAIGKFDGSDIHWFLVSVRQNTVVKAEMLRCICGEDRINLIDPSLTGWYRRANSEREIVLEVEAAEGGRVEET